MLHIQDIYIHTYIQLVWASGVDSTHVEGFDAAHARAARSDIVQTNPPESAGTAPALRVCMYVCVYTCM